MNVEGRGSGAARVRAALGSLRARAASDPSELEARLARLEHQQRRHRDELLEHMEQLESVIEGLQDAMHREAVRHDELIAALDKKTEPSEIARALSEDARRRGL